MKFIPVGLGCYVLEILLCDNLPIIHNLITVHILTAYFTPVVVMALLVGFGSNFLRTGAIRVKKNFNKKQVKVQSWE